MNKYRLILIVIIALLVLVAAIVFIFGVRREGSEAFSGELEVWSFEDKEAWAAIIAGFTKQYPRLEIIYVQKNPATYETDLLNALAAGKGPDVFAMHHTWLTRHHNKVAPFPQEIMDREEFERTFAPVASRDLLGGSTVYALPLYIDTLALYYNEDLFNVSGVTAPPRTWEEFNSVVKRTTVKSAAGDILQAGVPLGTAENVEHAADILTLLMLQNGTTMVDPETYTAEFHRPAEGAPGENALQYYTNFANALSPVYTWNRRLPSSLEAFAGGTAAMYLGYARDLPRLAGNPGLRFRVAPIPQAALRTEMPSYLDLSYAQYTAGAVSQASERKEAAWTFLLFATSKNGAHSYLAATGLPTARRDLIETQANDRATGRTVGIFAGQIMTAASFPRPNENEVVRIFEGAIEDVALRGLRPQEALGEAARKYNALVEGK